MASKELRLAILQDSIDQHRKLYGSVGELEDGYHTLNELYEHRIQLWIACCKLANGIGSVFQVWKSQKHSDGSNWEGWFLLGMKQTPGEQMTYHLPMSKWDECSFAETLDQAPEFDGHSSQDVLERLKNL